MSWMRLLIFLQYIEITIACYSNGNFDCTKLWYFWFGVFWACFILFIAIICIINKCTGDKNKIAADLHFPVPRKRSRKLKLAGARPGSLSGSLRSQATDQTELSPQPSTPGQLRTSPRITTTTTTTITATTITTTNNNSLRTMAALNAGLQARSNTPSGSQSLQGLSSHPPMSFIHTSQRMFRSPVPYQNRVHNETATISPLAVEEMEQTSVTMFPQESSQKHSNTSVQDDEEFSTE